MRATPKNYKNPERKSKGRMWEAPDVEDRAEFSRVVPEGKKQQV